MNFRDKLAGTGPKKLLALDGGGIRGVITLEILAKIEDILRKQAKNDNLVLADYFDYVGGTSTGAIISTCISIGMSVAEIQKFYRDSGATMFSKAGLLKRFWYKFEDDNLARQLQQVLLDRDTGAPMMFGSDKLRTLLMLVLRNASTDSPWPLSNNPNAKYNDRTRPDCNLDLPLWKLVRASTAAPTYFPPEIVSIGSHDFVFVDGGVTMFNNPAFQLFLMATLPPYKLQWEAGEDKMLLVSVGTGVAADANTNLNEGEMNLLYQAGSIPSALMFAAQANQDLMCRTFGKTLYGPVLDRELGDMAGVAGPAPKLFTYMRYNADLDRAGLNALGLPGIDPKNVQQMDNIDHIGEMAQVGAAVANLHVKPEHFAAFPA